MALRRVFLAVTLPDEERHRMAALLSGVGIPGRVVPPQKWHITLRFLGETEEPTVDRLQAALDEADLGSPFDIHWGGLGAFPRASKASVLWIGLTAGEDQLRETAAAVETAIDVAGIPAEDRPFRPHLTISRIRPEEDVRRLVDSVPPLGGGMRVTAVDLYESHLGRGGARYEVVESFPLR